MSGRGALLLIVALGLAFGVGWAAGASGRTNVDLALADAGLRAEREAIRAEILEGRLTLTGLDASEASARFRAARSRAARLQTRLRELGQSDHAGQMEIVLALLTDADRQAPSATSGADRSAVDALHALAAAAPEPLIR